MKVHQRACCEKKRWTRAVLRRGSGSMRLGILCLTTLSVLGWPLTGTTAAGPSEGEVYFSVLGGAYGKPSGLNLRKGDTGVGGAMGFAFHNRWSVEAMLFDSDTHYDLGVNRGVGDMDYWSVNVLVPVGQRQRWQPFLAIGGGRASYDYDGLQPKIEDEVYTAGVGLFSKIGAWLSFRAELKAAYHHDIDAVSPMATAGLTVFLGGRREPAAAPVVVTDSDGDGVPDDRDACPGTPFGVRVDDRGCAIPVDSDADGVNDAADRCPNTAAGTPVDHYGCPADSDQDGVTDNRDACPGTPAGARVDVRGCEVVLERPVSFNLTSEFEFDSAEITGAGMEEMFDLLRFLREYPSTTAVIEGHTDDQGPEDYNQNLSERRAQAVLEALVNSGIDRKRLTARGYGESRPIASNDTPEGRAKNRRVTVTVSGTTTRSE